MQIITSHSEALKCLDNNVTGGDLYQQLSTYTEDAYKTSKQLQDLEFDGIICILRAALPMALTLYKLSNKKMGFISARRREDLSIEINYKKVPEFKKPLLVDAWVATGNTVVEVAKELNIKEINLFCLIASKQAINLIKPKNLIVGHIADDMTDKSYIIPPHPFKPRDGGDDMFYCN
ncbi:MAG TPA: uracil phosphoribosyltransferase [bacterium]|nr:uracil phosphoribosyltransferase [bacterium]